MIPGPRMRRRPANPAPPPGPAGLDPPRLELATFLPAASEGPAFLLLALILVALGAGRMARELRRPPGALRPPEVKVDLNREPPSGLMVLPGVGPRRAAAIVTFRTDHGPFRRPEDLARVPGIGPGLVRRLGPFVRNPAAAAPPRPASSGCRRGHRTGAASRTRGPANR